MKIESGENLTIQDCLSTTIFVMWDKETDYYYHTFVLNLPEDEEEVDMAQLYELLEGIEFAGEKIQQLISDLEDGNEEDEDDEEDWDED